MAFPAFPHPSLFNIPMGDLRHKTPRQSVPDLKTSKWKMVEAAGSPQSA
jgi:hypothetical protein